MATAKPTKSPAAWVSSTVETVRKGRFFGVFIGIFLLFGSLGGIYYFRIEAKKEAFRQYRFQSLDELYTGSQKWLDNKWAIQKQNDSVPDSIPEAVLRTWLEEAIERSNWKNHFDAFLVVSTSDSFVWYKSTTGAVQVVPDSLLSRGPKGLQVFQAGTSRKVSFGEAKYHLFSRLYDLSGESPITFDAEINTQLRSLAFCGLVTQKRFRAENMQLDAWVIALLVTVLLLVIIGLPVMKLLLISEIERLYSRDVILAGLSVILGAPILALVFLSLFLYAFHFYKEIPERLASLCNQVETRFAQENQSIVTELAQLNLDTLAKHSAPNAFNYAPITPGKAHLKAHANFKYLTLTDSVGEVKTHYALIEPPKRRTTQLGKRKYFQDLKAGKVRTQQVSWSVGSTGKDSTTIAYAMRPIISLESETEEAVYVFRGDASRGFSRDTSTLAASTQLQSLHQAIVPPGYAFAVLDEAGEVWFHSTTEKSTLENFFRATRDNDVLKAAMYGHVASSTQLDYLGRQHLAYVMPMGETGLYVVSMFDIAHLRLQFSEVLSLCSLAVLFAFLVTGFFTVFTVYLRPGRNHFYGYRPFRFSFLEPHSEKASDYVLISVVFAVFVLISLVLGWSIPASPAEVFLVNILLMVWGYLTVFYWFHLSAKETSFRLRWNDALVPVLLLLLNAAAWKFLPPISAWLIIGCQVVYVLFWMVAWRARRILKVRIERYFSGSVKRYRSSYLRFLFLWLIVTALLPSYRYFNKAYEIEQRIWSKYSQWQVGRQYEQKRELLRSHLPFHGTDETRDQIYEEHLRNGLYLTDPFMGPPHTGEPPEDHEWEPSTLRRLLWRYRPVYDRAVAETQPMIFKEAKDHSWSGKELWIGNGADTIEFVTTTAPRARALHSILRLDSPDFGWWYAVLWIAGVAFLMGFYWTIRFFVTRIFGFHYARYRPSQLYDEEVDSQRLADLLREGARCRGIVVVGVPFSGKRSLAEEIIERTKYQDCKELSFLRDIDSAQLRVPLKTNPDSTTEAASDAAEGHDLYLIDHLEHTYTSVEENQKKLEVITALVHAQKPMILLSEVYPSQILSFLKKQAQQGVEGALDTYTAWRNLSGLFVEVVHGMFNHPEQVRPHMVGYSASDRDFVCEEVGYGLQLPSLTPLLLQYNTLEGVHGGNVIDRELFIRHTHSLAYGYYNDIWNALATRERFVLYDLAKDGFVNVKNGTALYSLIMKGLVVWRDKPVLFNRSFGAFIVSSVDREEASGMDRAIERQGSWNVSRIVVYGLILGLIGFLLIGEPSFTEDFQTFVGVLAGIATVVPTLSAVLGGRSS